MGACKDAVHERGDARSCAPMTGRVLGDVLRQYCGCEALADIHVRVWWDPAISA